MCLLCRAADAVESALLVGVDHLVPVETGLPWYARNNIDVGVIAALAALPALLAFLVYQLLLWVVAAIQYPMQLLKQEEAAGKAALAQKNKTSKTA